MTKVLLPHFQLNAPNISSHGRALLKCFSACMQYHSLVWIRPACKKFGSVFLTVLKRWSLSWFVWSQKRRTPPGMLKNACCRSVRYHYNHMLLYLSLIFNQFHLWQVKNPLDVFLIWPWTQLYPFLKVNRKWKWDAAQTAAPFCSQNGRDTVWSCQLGWSAGLLFSRKGKLVSRSYSDVCVPFPALLFGRQILCVKFSAPWALY